MAQYFRNVFFMDMPDAHSNGRGAVDGRGQLTMPNHLQSTRNDAQASHGQEKSLASRRPSTSGIGSRGTGTRSSLSYYSSSDSNCSEHLVNHQDGRSPSRSSMRERPESVAKSILSRGGRALKRHGSKLSLSTSISFEKDADQGHVWTVSGLGAPGRSQSNGSLAAMARKESLKRAISAPFAFKHVTHTQHAQVRGLERVSRNELISEFSAIRAGQSAKPELRGIKAQDLSNKSSPLVVSQAQPECPSPSSCHSPNSPSTKPPQEPQASPSEPVQTASQTVNPASTTPIAEIHTVTPPRSPQHTTVDANGHRHSRSGENFSRPASRASFSPITPPKRVSSRNACLPMIVSGGSIIKIGDSATSKATSSPVYTTSSAGPSSPRIDKPSTERHFEPHIFGHALSTPDDSARPLKTAPLPVLPGDLEDVPEEEESLVRRESNEWHAQNRADGSGLRSVKSVPTLQQPRERIWPSHDASGPDQEASPLRANANEAHLNLEEDGNGSTFFVSPSCRTNKRISVGLKPISVDHWEDDVDYCYEHAAEANCDFEWDHVMNHPGAAPHVGLTSHDNPLHLLHTTFDPFAESGEGTSKSGLDSLHRKHDSQESSILSIASSIVDISRASNSIGSLPELEPSVNSSRESVDTRSTKQAQRPRVSGPTKRPKNRSPAMSYSLFPSSATPPRSP